MLNKLVFSTKEENNQMKETKTNIVYEKLLKAKPYSASLCKYKIYENINLMIDNVATEHSSDEDVIGAFNVSPRKTLGTMKSTFKEEAFDSDHNEEDIEY